MGYLDSLYFTHYLIIKLFFPTSSVGGGTARIPGGAGEWLD